jgi:long-chain fatty acid transport protein
MMAVAEVVTGRIRFRAALAALAMAPAVIISIAAYGADGNELFGIGAIQKGLGGAGVASPQDATWALLNPAGLVDLDRRLDLSIELFSNRVWSQPRGFPLAANPWAGEMRVGNVVPIPSGGMVWPLARGTLAFGVFGVQGNVADFPRPRTTLSLLANSDRRSQYEVARIPLAYGYRFDNGWAVGGAVVGAVTRLRIDSITLALRPTRGDYHWDVAFGAGFELGVYKRWEHWSVGAAYSSRVWMDDYARYKSDLVRWNFDLPQKLQAGVALRPHARLEVLLDYKWIDWSATKLLGNSPIHGGVGWRDQHIVKAGFAWEVDARWSLRSGVSWGEAPVRRQFSFANALTPALAEVHVALGASYRLDDRTTIHGALAYAPRKTASENGQGDIFSLLGHGTTIGYQENALIVQVTRKF